MQVKVKSLQYRYFLDKYLFSDSYFLQSFLINLHTYSRTLRNIHCTININNKNKIRYLFITLLYLHICFPEVYINNLSKGLIRVQSYIIIT